MEVCQDARTRKGLSRFHKKKRKEWKNSQLRLFCNRLRQISEAHDYKVLDGRTYMRGPAGVLIHHMPELVNRLSETVDESKYVDDFAGK